MALTAASNLLENKKIAIITGNDKPQVCIEGNFVYGYFLDTLFTTARNHTHDDNRVVELFYYSDDLPELPIKGCQLLAKHLQKNKQLEEYFLNKKLSYEKKHIKDAIIRSIVYREWDTNTFQVGKTRLEFFAEFDNWIQEHFGNEYFFQSWQKNMSFYFENIDKKYFNYNEFGKKIGYIGFISPLYKICNLA